MKHNILMATSAAAALMGLCSLVPFGDLEVVCDTSGNPIIERWAQGTQNIPWQITYRSIESTSGSFTDQCDFGSLDLTSFPANYAPADMPWVKALTEGARAWNDVPMPEGFDSQGNTVSPGGDVGVNVSFSEDPTFVLEKTLFSGSSTFDYNAGMNPGQFGVVTAFVYTCNSSFQPPFRYFPQPDLLNGGFITEDLAATFAMDGSNTVDMVEDARYWQGALGIPSTALAASRPYLSTTNPGEIIEFDLIFNGLVFNFTWNAQGFVAITPGDGHSWVYEDDKLDQVLGFPGASGVSWSGSSTLYGLDVPLGPPCASATLNSPDIAFVDLEGVAVHEFGHSLGLGHTLLAAGGNLDEPDGGLEDVTEFPTMFPFAQASTLAQAYDPASPLQAPGQVNPSIQSFQAMTDPNALDDSVTAFEGNSYIRGVIGASARSLELDDIAAIVRGYPAFGVGSKTVSITGSATLGGSPYVGARVIAISNKYPDRAIAETLTYSNGGFKLEALPPGQYVLRIDAYPTEVFGGAGLPEMIEVGIAAMSGGTDNCGVDFVDFPSEFWDDDDTAYESASEVTVINLTTPGSSAQATFVLDDRAFGSWTNPVLSANSGASVGGTTSASESIFFSGPSRAMMPVQSGHLWAASPGATSFAVNMSIDADPAWAGSAFKLYANKDQGSYQRLGNQFQVVPDVDLLVPGILSGTLDANGDWTGVVDVQVKPVVTRENLHIEAVVYPANKDLGPAVPTNMVQVWFGL